MSNKKSNTGIEKKKYLDFSVTNLQNMSILSNK